MKLDLTREQLLQPLETVIGVVGAKQTMEILSHVKLSFKEDKLSITGTDLEVELVGQSQIATTDQLDHITLPGKKLIEICKSLPEKSLIKLSKQKEQYILHSGKSKFILSSFAADDFPDMGEFQGNASFEITQKAFKTLLQRTQFAMAHHDVRYYLNGMLLEISSGSIRVVATDGHRLAANTLSTSTKTDHKIQNIIPRKAVLELIRLLGDTDQPLQVQIGNNFIRAISDQFTFTSKLIEGRFPDYERVIPKNNDKKVFLDKNEFKKSLSRSAILCNDKFKGIKIEIASGKMKIFASNPEHEKAEESINLVYDDEKLEMGFNVAYLLENINTLKSDQVALLFSSSNKSILIEEVDSPHDSYFVLMPMRL